MRQTPHLSALKSLLSGYGLSKMGAIITRSSISKTIFFPLDISHISRSKWPKCVHEELCQTMVRRISFGSANVCSFLLCRINLHLPLEKVVRLLNKRQYISLRLFHVNEVDIFSQLLVPNKKANPTKRGVVLLITLIIGYI